MNRVDLVGRLTKDPELRYIPGSGTPVATFTIAINRDFVKKDGTRDADFIPVEIIGKRAEAVANWLVKGRLAAITGQIRVDNYQTKEGERRTFTKVAAEQVEFLERDKNKNQPSGNEPPKDYSAVNDPEIPF